MRPGVAGLLPRHPAAITAAHGARLRELGFTGASIGVDPDATTDRALTEAREVLAAHGVRVAQVTASYPALVSEDESPRREGIRIVQRACRATRLLDGVFFLVRSGTLRPGRGSDYRPDPANYTPAARDRLVRSLIQASAAAEQEGVLLGLECHVTTTLRSPRDVREIVEAVGSPALRYNADPVNFVSSLADAFHTTPLLHHVFEELGPYIVSAHVKDVCVGERLIVHLDECAPGAGIFDLATFLRLYEQYHPDGYAMIEHLPDSQVPAAKQALDAVLTGAGLSWKV